jgi:CheY-like chemotaxis protein
MSRILIVDDDSSVCTSMKSWLEHDGYEVIVADSGRGAIAALVASSFDLVIVDIFMPGMDGLETIKILHHHAPEVPIIAMSGFMFRNATAPAPDFLSMSTKLGAAHSLHKPFRPRELLDAIEACLGTKRTTPMRATG